jgi:hypothetical protein
VVNGVAEEIIKGGSFREDDAEERADVGRVRGGAGAAGGGRGDAEADLLDRDDTAYIEA